jgi:hypothetical protein
MSKESPDMGNESPFSLELYYTEIKPGEEVGYQWGQLSGSFHRLHFVAEEFESASRERDVDLALSRLMYTVENYLPRVYELRERLLALLKAISGCNNKAIGRLKNPTIRKAAAKSLEEASDRPIKIPVRLLDSLDEDIELRTQQTHKNFLDFGLYTGDDIYNPQDALLDLNRKPKDRQLLENLLRKEIQRHVKEYTQKIYAISEMVRNFLEETSPVHSRKP